MATKFEYTFSCIDMTVEVMFDFSTYQNWLDDNHYETFVDNVEIMRVTCGEWDVTALLDESAPIKAQRELLDACYEYAANK